MDILDVLNELEELVEESTKLPLVGKILIDDELVLDMVDHIRSSLPEEMRQAKNLMAEREKILADAKAEASRIVTQAREEIAKMVDEEELVKQARIKAEEVIEQAKALSREIKIGAYQFADDLLGNSEQKIGQILSQVKAAREELRTPPKGEQEAAATK